MKKLFLIGALFCASVSASASTRWVTSCGIVFETVSFADFPGSMAEYTKFLIDTNEDLCHVRKQPKIFNKGDDLLIIP